MKKVDGEIYYTIGEVAKMLKRGTQTIKNWYAWQEQSEAQNDTLPTIYTDIDAKGTRYFKEADIDTLRVFRDNITYGMMSEFNREKWGTRGQVKKES